jgi:mannose-6-phosphate isomerase-like protein (cupin superfamily)
MTPATTARTTGLRLDRRTVLHCASDQSMQPVAVDDAAWADRSAVAAFRDGRILSVFDYTSSWTWWERHPTGEEFVHVLAGDVVFHLEDGDGRRSVELHAGSGAVVPRGAWHRAEIVTPATVLFLTPTPAWTEHRDA